MNKLLIPTILVATIMIAGVFAFNPVEKASTVHTTIGTTAHILTTTMVLPTSGDTVDVIIDCGVTGGLITAFFMNNDATNPLTELDFIIQSIAVDDDTDQRFRQGSVGGIVFSGMDNSAHRKLGDFINFSGDDGLLCPPGQTIFYAFYSTNGANVVTVDVFVAFAGDPGAGISTAAGGAPIEV